MKHPLYQQIRHCIFKFLSPPLTSSLSCNNFTSSQERQIDLKEHHQVLGSFVHWRLLSLSQDASSSSSSSSSLELRRKRSSISILNVFSFEVMTFVICKNSRSKCIYCRCSEGLKPRNEKSPSACIFLIFHALWWCKKWKSFPISSSKKRRWETNKVKKERDEAVVWKNGHLEEQKFQVKSHLNHLIICFIIIIVNGFLHTFHGNQQIKKGMRRRRWERRKKDNEEGTRMRISCFVRSVAKTFWSAKKNVNSNDLSIDSCFRYWCKRREDTKKHIFLRLVSVFILYLIQESSVAETRRASAITYFATKR